MEHAHEPGRVQVREPAPGRRPARGTRAARARRSRDPAASSSDANASEPVPADGEHDEVGPLRLDDRGQLRERAEHRNPCDRSARVLVVDDPDHLVAPVAVQPELLEQLLAAVVRADDQHAAALDGARADEPLPGELEHEDRECDLDDHPRVDRQPGSPERERGDRDRAGERPKCRCPGLAERGARRAARGQHRLHRRVPDPGHRRGRRDRQPERVRLAERERERGEKDQAEPACRRRPLGATEPNAGKRPCAELCVPDKVRRVDRLVQLQTHVPSLPPFPLPRGLWEPIPYLS